jgi:hypothetical protein
MILHPAVLIEADGPTPAVSGALDNVLGGTLNANINAPIEGSVKASVRISNVPVPLLIIGGVTAAYAVPIIASTTVAIAKEVAKKVSEGSAKIYRAAPEIAATSMLLISGWYAYNTTSYAHAFWTALALLSAGYMGYYYAQGSPAQATEHHARPHAGPAINNYYNYNARR